MAKVGKTKELLKFGGDSGSGGTPGLVPTPAAGDATKVLRGDGTFSDIVPIGPTITALTQDTSPLPADFLTTYDTSAAAAKKIALNACGGLQYLTSGSVSAATLDIVLTGYTTFRGLKFLLRIVPATDNTSLLMRVSTNGGSSYDSGAGSYQWTNTESRPTPVTNADGSASDTSMRICRGTSNTSTDGVHAWIDMMDHTSTARCTRITGLASVIESGGTLWNVTFGGCRTTAQDTDAVRFLMSSGNIVGDYAVYGYG